MNAHRLRFLRTAQYPAGRLQFYIDPCDLWVGLFIAPAAVYLLLLPCLVIRWSTRSTDMGAA